MQYLKNKVSLSLALFILLVACGPTPTPEPTPDGPKDLTPCKKSEDPNIYQPISSNSLSSFIYQNALLEPNTALFNLENLPNVQLDAYLRLAKTVEQWSASADVPVSIGGVGNQYFVRITLTFISPELIEMVLLNHSLAGSPVSKEAFVERVNAMINYFEKRKEMVFLATFTSSYKNPSVGDPNALWINANVNEIMLFDAKRNPIPISYSDPLLWQDVTISQGNLSGYIAYPMFVYRSKECTETLDREYVTTMTLQVGKLLIKEEERGPVALSIRYHPILDVNDPNKLAPIPIPDSSLIREPGMESNPPHPIVGVNNTDILYWQRMASYVWWYLASP